MKKILKRSLLIGGITLLVASTITPIVVTTIINNKQNTIINKTDTNKYKFNDEEYILNILDEYNEKIDKLSQSEKSEIANNLINSSQSILQEMDQDKKILKLKARENINNEKFISKFKLNDDYTLSYINGY